MGCRHITVQASHVHAALHSKAARSHQNQPVVEVLPVPTTSLGNWYAHALFWTPQVALLVNEQTLLPVLMPLAPASTLQARFPAHLAAVLEELGASAQFIAGEVDAMTETVLARTASRKVLGSLNEFAFLADGYRENLESPDLQLLSLKLTDTPCRPMKGNSPARVLGELVAAIGKN